MTASLTFVPYEMTTDSVIMAEVVWQSFSLVPHKRNSRCLFFTKQQYSESSCTVSSNGIVAFICMVLCNQILTGLLRYPRLPQIRTDFELSSLPQTFPRFIPRINGRFPSFSRKWVDEYVMSLSRNFRRDPTLLGARVWHLNGGTTYELYRKCMLFNLSF